MAEAFLYFDGACRGNGTGSAVGACGYVLKNMDGSIIFEDGIFLGPFFTNNGAEYKGLIAGLRKARIFDIRTIHVRGDSELVCRQVLGKYRVKNARLIMYYNTVLDLLEDCFDDYSVQSIPRAQNTRADELAREAFTHSVEDYSWGISLALVVGRVPKKAWKYLLQQRIHGQYRIAFLLGVIAKNYPDVFEAIGACCWNMNHVDDDLRDAGKMTHVIVTA